MALSVQQLINHSYQLAGVLDTDETADGADGAIAVIKLNEFIGQANIDQLLPFAQVIETYTPSVLKNTYTIGLDTSVDTPDILAVSPMFIERILYQTSGESRARTLEGIDLIDLLSYRTSNSSTPSYFGVNETYPNSTIYFDTVLPAGCTLTIIYNKELPAALVNGDLLVPNSYADFLVCGLARKLAVLKKMPAETLQSIDLLYKEAKTRIQHNNGRRQTPTISAGFVENVMSFNAEFN